MQIDADALTQPSYDWFPAIDSQTAEARNNLVLLLSRLTANSIQIVRTAEEPNAPVLNFLPVSPGYQPTSTFVTYVSSKFAQIRIFADNQLIERLMVAHLPGWQNEKSEALNNPMLIATFLWEKLSSLISPEGNHFAVTGAAYQCDTKDHTDPFCLVGLIEIAGKEYKWGILLDKFDRSNLSVCDKNPGCSLWYDLPSRMQVGIQRSLFLYELRKMQRGCVLILCSKSESRLKLYGRAGQWGRWKFQASIDTLGKLICYDASLGNILAYNPKKIGHSLNNGQNVKKHNKRQWQDHMGTNLWKSEPCLKMSNNADVDQQSDDTCYTNKDNLAIQEEERDDKKDPVLVDSDTTHNTEFDISTVRISLDVELGQINLDLVGLSEIREGTILETELNLSAPKTIKIDGSPVGNGELVLIDDALGLHITSWSRKTFA